MRKLIFALVLAAVACGPRGFYVANVYSVNGALVQEKCEVTFNGRANPDNCHVEPVAQAQLPQAPAYAPAPTYGQPPAPPAPAPGY